MALGGNSDANIATTTGVAQLLSNSTNVEKLTVLLQNYDAIMQHIV